MVGEGDSPESLGQPLGIYFSEIFSWVGNDSDEDNGDNENEDDENGFQNDPDAYDEGEEGEDDGDPTYNPIQDPAPVEEELLIDDEDIVEGSRTASGITPNPTVYPELGTNGYLGGVHTGRVILMLVEKVWVSGQERRRGRFISKPNSSKKITGGQFYMPMMMFNNLKKQRVPTKWLRRLPTNLTRILNGNFDTVAKFEEDSYKKTLDTVRNLLYTKDNVNRRIQRCSQFPIRIELFVSHQVHSDRNWIMPSIDFKNILCGSFYEDLSDFLGKQLNGNFDPIRALFLVLEKKRASVGYQGMLDWVRKNAPSVKTRFVYHAEMMLKIREVTRCLEGQICKKLVPLVHYEDPVFYGLERSNLILVPEMYKELYDMHFGICSSLLQLPKYKHGFQIKYRAKPAFWEASCPDYNQQLECSEMYLVSVGLVLNLCLEYCLCTEVDIDVAKGLEFGFFETIDFQRLARMEEGVILPFLKELARIVWNCYHAEIAYTMLDREKEFRLPVKLTSRQMKYFQPKNFPSTEAEFDSFRRRYGGVLFVRVQNEEFNESCEITDPSK